MHIIKSSQESSVFKVQKHYTISTWWTIVRRTVIGLAWANFATIRPSCFKFSFASRFKIRLVSNCTDSEENEGDKESSFKHSVQTVPNIHIDHQHTLAVCLAAKSIGMRSSSFSLHTHTHTQNKKILVNKINTMGSTTTWKQKRSLIL